MLYLLFRRKRSRPGGGQEQTGRIERSEPEGTATECTPQTSAVELDASISGSEFHGKRKMHEFGPKRTDRVHET